MSDRNGAPAPVGPNYVGWVAYVGGQPATMPDGHGGHMTAWQGGTPIFEAVRKDPSLDSVLPGARDQARRQAGRRTLEWEDLPQDRVVRLELYFARDVWDQPCARLDRAEGFAGDSRWRWIQYKHRSKVVPAHRESILDGPTRTGIQKWTVGCVRPMADGWGAVRVEFDPSTGEQRQEEIRAHPCWPTTAGGWGLAPHVLGLDPDEVPDPPATLSRR